MRLWKEITNLSAPKNTHTDFELTAAIGKVASNTQPNRKSSLRRRRVKCEEQKHVNLLHPKRIGVAGKRRHPSEMTNVTRQLIFGDDDDTHSVCVCVTAKLIFTWSDPGLNHEQSTLTTEFRAEFGGKKMQ